MSHDDLFRLTATDAVAALRKGEVSSLELVDAAAARIEAVNRQVNALPILCLDKARERARSMTPAAPDGVDPSCWLAGLPFAVKDYNDLAGIPTTMGSPIFAERVPERSDATIARLERHGAVAVGKSNVPEFAGGNTVNPVFGATRNPWDTRLSAGGSSGGAAVALASGMTWMANGSDLGGSLRTPASFNGVVGLRPGPGRVPRGTALPAFDSLWVEGPMGRTVADAALMLDAGAGFEADDPLSFETPPGIFTAGLEKSDLPRRVGFSRDLGGIVPVEAEIAEICANAARRFGEIGADVTDECPDFTGVLAAFHTLRGVLFGTSMGATLDAHRDAISPDIVWNIEKGLQVTSEDLLSAQRTRWALYHRMVAFFQTHDLLICPAVSVSPFAVENNWVEVIDGKPCATYIDWFAITFALTMTACPVLALPCGMTRAGLPVGLQLVGRPRGEEALLRAGHRMEEVFGMAQRLPIDPRRGGA